MDYVLVDFVMSHWSSVRWVDPTFDSQRRMRLAFVGYNHLTVTS